MADLPHKLYVAIRDPVDLEAQNQAEDGQVDPLPKFYANASSFDLSLSLCVLKLPHPDTISPLHFTSLTIFETSSVGSSQPRDLLRFLTAFPVLEDLSLLLWSQEYTFTDDLPEPVELPNLHTLAIRHTLSTRFLLSRLRTPALQELELAHLNVATPLLADFPNETEPGDSDDEAADFSQSPFSDHATGMGLRALLRHAPLLEVLEMDYADMRTKDFRWAFDALDNLREFRIVASDMSDTVINLLRPHVVDGPDGARELPTMRLRMPRLGCLELTGCQRLSGTAIVDALRARELFARNARDVAQLHQVGIYNCANFAPTHEHMLARVLGTRLAIN